jgi:DNA-binding response OmpR family regulator
LNRIAGGLPVYMSAMASHGTLLCIHRDPSQLRLLKENGYELATATNGSDGLRLFMSHPVHAVLLEYHLGLLDGATIADHIKQIRPEVPIVMLVDHVELPADALKSVDALVVKSDGPHFLLATVHFVLNVKPAQRHKAQRERRSHTLNHPRLSVSSRGRASRRQANHSQSATAEKDTPFSREVWRNIQDGSIQF